MEEAVGRAEAEDMLDRCLSETRDQHANALAELERTRAARSLADDERVRTAAAERGKDAGVRETQQDDPRFGPFAST